MQYEEKEVTFLTPNQKVLLRSLVTMRRTELVLAEDNPDIINMWTDVLVQLGGK